MAFDGRGQGRQGRGRGGGSGKGRGRGRGRGRACMRSLAPPPLSQPPLNPAGALDSSSLPVQSPENRNEDELALLKQQASAVERELTNVRSRLADRPAPAHRRVAVVDHAHCTACGICASSCPYDAIRVDGAAEVDLSRCAGCGACAYACPSGAIRMETMSIGSPNGQA